MKRLVCIITSLLILLSLVACAQKQNSGPQDTTAPENTTNATEITTGSSETTIPAEDLPIISQPMSYVIMSPQNEVYTTEDGTVLLNYNTQFMILSTIEDEIAHRITVEFLNRIDETVATKDSILSTAQGAYASNSANWIPYQYTITYSPKRIDNGVLSLLGCNASYLGGHIDKIYNSVNYNMTTGHNLSLPNIINGNEQVDVLCQLVIETLKANKDQYSLHDDFSDTVKQHFINGINDAWYFSANGLCFFFSPYDIAPYSAGVVIAEIPYERLTGILKDDYFPAEQANAPGTIAIKEYTEENLNDFVNVAELTLTEDKNKFLLFTNKAVNDIVISKGTVTASGVFIEERAVFALSSLTNENAIEVYADITDNNALQISYYSGNQLITQTIVYNADTLQIEFLDK